MALKLVIKLLKHMAYARNVNNLKSTLLIYSVTLRTLMKNIFTYLCVIFSFINLQNVSAKGAPFDDKFRQLDEILPTANIYRNASGAPGHKYWQQAVNYKIKVSLDDKNQRLTGSEIITYQNNSPDTLRYIWIQLDQNRFEQGSSYKTTSTAPAKEKITYKGFRKLVKMPEFEGGYQITKVTSENNPIHHVINGTMMRIDLPKPLRTGDEIDIEIDWQYQIHEQKVLGGRSGFEYFEKDDNYLYEIAQWFPRAAAYYDVYGWQNKQFLGNGEFTLEFGDYDVEITVPADHVVASTGVLNNPKKVLSKAQRQRYSDAKTANKPVLIITPDEALANEKSRSEETKTWHFKAKNVRDFA